MPRIRTVKPDFWEDETVGACTRDARLLFVATFNMADDEGLLRWTPDYVKAQAFMYDDDLTSSDCAALMLELTESGLIYPYRGGKTQQRLAWIVNFRKHQKINRPQPSKLSPPSLQQAEVILTLARRDGFTCHLCGLPTLEQMAPYSGNPYDVGSGPDLQCIQPSPDHVAPQANGGDHCPSNLRTAHLGCNKARRDRPLTDQFTPPASVLHALEHEGLVSDSENDHGTVHGTDGTFHAQNSVNEAVNDAVNPSSQVAAGREEEGEEEGEWKGTKSITSEADATDTIRQDVDQLCDYFADAIVANGARRPNIATKAWRDPCRLMLDRDGRTPEEIRGAIRWSQAHEFWRSNVLSMSKLREKYDTLRLQAERSNQPTPIRNFRQEATDDLFDAAMERALEADRSAS